MRITTRVNRNFLPMALFGTMHESGHGMYEQGVNPALDRTPLCRGASPGVHESQSRLWENLVGRSRAFWQGYFPKLQAAFPDQLRRRRRWSSFYRAVNKVTPSLIRVEADEVTYNLHILLRFELELALLEGKLQRGRPAGSLERAMQEYLGITPPDDAAGRAAGHPLVGRRLRRLPRLHARQHHRRATVRRRPARHLPDLDAQIRARASSRALHDWLRTNLYQHGRKFTPNELLERITGGPLSTAPWIAYVRRKFGELCTASRRLILPAPRAASPAAPAAAGARARWRARFATPSPGCSMWPAPSATSASTWPRARWRRPAGARARLRAARMGRPRHVITLVLTPEMVNTVVEAAVDLASPAYHPLAKIAKDVAAGAVLVRRSARWSWACSCSCPTYCGWCIDQRDWLVGAPRCLMRSRAIHRAVLVTRPHDHSPSGSRKLYQKPRGMMKILKNCKITLDRVLLFGLSDILAECAAYQDRKWVAWMWILRKFAVVERVR